MALVKLDKKNALVPYVNNKTTNKNQLFPLCTQDYKTINYSSKLEFFYSNIHKKSNSIFENK